MIFVIVADPVGSGFVKSLAHPGGNATGFTIMEPSIVSKWLELLKEIAPHVTRARIVRRVDGIVRVREPLRPLPSCAWR